MYRYASIEELLEAESRGGASPPLPGPGDRPSDGTAVEVTIARSERFGTHAHSVRFLTERLGLAHPIIQAPLAGGGDTPALVAAVSEAGALGFVGASYLTPDQIAAAAQAVRGLTARPFGINLFAPSARTGGARERARRARRVAPFFAELGLAAPRRRPLPGRHFAAHFEAALDERRLGLQLHVRRCCPPRRIAAIKATRHVRSSAPRPRSRRRSRSSAPASMPSSRRAARRAAIAARSTARTLTRGWWARSRSCRRSSTR